MYKLENQSSRTVRRQIMAISEQIELLGKGVYQDKGIPPVITIEAIPTISELEYVSSEDFDKTMIEKILPSAVKEKFSFYDLLEIDYHWVLRCLRIINYGPYHTTNTLFCENCGRMYGEYRVNLNSVECRPLPQGFKNDIVIGKDEFIEYDKNVRIHLLTIREALQAEKDTAFMKSDGTINKVLARTCYMIKEMGNDSNISPVDVRMKISKEFSSPDYMILKDMINDLTNYGVRAGGITKCPKCGGEAGFVALVDDRYFRPTLDDLRQWKADKRERRDQDSAGNSAKDVRKHS